MKQLNDSILRARKVGHDSILVGSHLIVETTDFGSFESKKKTKAYFKSKHASVKDQWGKNGDFVFGCWAIEKLEFAKNYAPYTIFPFHDDIVADILMGKIWIHYLLNNNEVIRALERGGWRLVESFLDIPEEEFTKPGAEDLTFYKLRKGAFTISIPAAWFGRLCFEMISPKVILDELDRQCQMNDSQGNVYLIPHFWDDERIWN